MKFRSDVNGLRGYAVIGVVLFHFSVPGFSGGFSGVDVFFVISGYLMTRIIFERMDAGRFSILDFYMDRARRIIPPLAVLCAVLFALGWIFLLPNDLLLLGKQIATAITFTSNVMFWREAGYFDSAAHLKWMLHTWSLSVEWQFYILYPIILGLFCRLFSWRVAVICGLAVLSFAASQYLTARYPTAAFFLLPARAWEMLLGGLVFLLPLRGSQPVRKALEVAGIVLIVLPIFWFSAADAWPGWRAGVPVVGTALVIWAQQGHSLLTANPVMTWLGRISYSLYLWHWPIAVGIHQYEIEMGPLQMVLGIGASLVLGQLSFSLVEGNSKGLWRMPKLGSPLRARLAPVLACLLVPVTLGAASSAVWKTRGVPARFSPEVAQADAAARDFNLQDTRCFVRSGTPAPPCVFGDAKRISAEMIGDSHASATVTALVEAAAPGGVKYQAYAGCPTLRGVRPLGPESQCDRFLHTYLDPMIDGPKSDVPLVIVNYWPNYAGTRNFEVVTPNGDDASARPLTRDAYRQRFLDTVCAVAAKRPTYVTLPLPRYAFEVAKRLARDLARDPSAPDISTDAAQYLEERKFLAGMMDEATACGVRLLDPAPYLCADGRCWGSIGHQPLYFDEHHLNETGNKRLVPMFRTIFSGQPQTAQGASLPAGPASLPAGSSATR